MKKILILLLILGCQNHEELCNMSLVISDASEIQFWPTGTPSFNLELMGFTDDYCFNQKFLCTGTRRLQGYGQQFDEDYYLIALDESGQELFTATFLNTNIYTTDAELAFSNETFSGPSITGWTNYTEAAKKSWVAGSIGPIAVAQSVGTTEPDSQELYAPRSVNGLGGYNKFPPGTYRIKINAHNNSSGGSGTLTESLVLKAFDVAGGSSESATQSGITRGGGFLDYEIELTTTQEWNYLAFAWEKDGTKTSSVINVFVNSIEILEYPLDYTFTKYSLSFIPSDEDMCDKLVRFKIFEADDIDTPDPETDTEVYYSDLVNFVSTWANGPASGRVIMQFKCNQNFADLIYDSGSPYFQIEFDGRFRKQKPITAQKNSDLSEMILTTAASVKIQRKLTIADVADYMHKKICLALAHAAAGSVVVNGIEISLEEGYEEGDRPETYPLTPAEVLLTIKNFYAHNII